MAKQPGDEIPTEEKTYVSEYIRTIEGRLLERYKDRVYNELSVGKSLKPFEGTIKEFMSSVKIRKDILETCSITEDHLRLILRNTLLNSIWND